jgi:hypothetical protein
MVIDTLAPQYIAPPILQAVFFFFLPISIFYLNMLLEKQFFLLNSSFKSVPGRFVPGCYTLAVSEALPEDLQV